MENTENKNYKEKILDTLDSLEKSLSKGFDKVKDSTAKGIDKLKEEAILEDAAKKFKAILRQQLIRVEDMKAQGDFVDYAALDTIRIGVCGGDGIGPIISAEARRVLEYMLADLVEAGKVEFMNIEGLTLENRIAHNQAIPDDVMDALKSCHIILKGPTTTPQKGSGMPNIESANVAMRKALDLFANIRPVKVPEEGINWTIFRENTEGGYAVGSSGFNVTEDLAVDFTITTKQGSDRIARLAYDYAKKNGFNRVSLVTKANVIKTTDGNFLEDCHKVADLYPEITTDEWYADIMTAKLVDQKRRRDFQVLLLPNLYGDIISDEAAEFQPTITPIYESEGFNYTVSMGYHFDFYLGGEYKANLMGHPRFNRTTTSSVTPIYAHELLESMYEHVCNDINIILKEIIDGKAVLITNETNPED